MMSPSVYKTYLLYALKVAILAVWYYVAGRLALFLVIPPGQAAAIWPSAGIALAALLLLGWRYWPAVLIGAMGTSLYHHTVIDLHAIMIALPIACGATLQAIFGCFLIKKYMVWPTALESAQDSIKITLLGGCSCIIGAVVGTLTLFVVGFVAQESLFSHFFVWWLGDALGVIVFTPIILLLCTPKSAGFCISSARKLIVLFVLFVVFIAVIYSFYGVKTYGDNQKIAQLNSQAFELSFNLQKELTVALEALSANERFISSSEYVSSDEFRVFTKRFIAHHKSIYGVSWIPKVKHENRATFTQSLREQGLPNFEIKRRTKLGIFERSEKQEVYFPIAYTEPYYRSSKAQGFDVYSDDPVAGLVRRIVLDAARDSGKALATDRFAIVQDENIYGFIIYYPVYSKDIDNLSVEERRTALIGYCNGVFALPSLMGSTYEKASQLGIDMLLYDISLGESAQVLLYDSRTPDNKEAKSEIVILASQHKTHRDIDVAGRKWRLNFIQHPEQSSANNWLLWVVMVGGLFFTGFTSLFMLVVTARTDVIKRLVDEKTQEITDSKSFLQLIMSINPDFIFVKDESLKLIEANKAFLETYPEDERDSVIGKYTSEGFSDEEAAEFFAMDRKAFEEGYADGIETITFPDEFTRTLYTQKIRFEETDGERFILCISRDVSEKEMLIDKLSESNAELEEFAYRTSHDLRSPLISSIALLSMAEKALETDNKSKLEQCLTHVKTSLIKLETLVQDILSLTETKNVSEDIQCVDVANIVQEAIYKMEHMEGYAKIKLNVDIQLTADIIVQKNRLVLIIENLISNAIKYQDSEEATPHLSIRSWNDDAVFIFEVEDNGLGIPEEHREHLFAMFKRFHPKVSFGSGLGLYMMKKSADILGADLVCETPEKGTVFRLSIPLK